MIFLPYQDIEDELGHYWDQRHEEIYYENLNVRGGSPKKRGKSLLKEYANKRVKTELEVFDFLFKNSPNGIEQFQAKLVEFLD